jgi:hypothetical protein
MVVLALILLDGCLFSFVLLMLVHCLSFLFGHFDVSLVFCYYLRMKIVVTETTELSSLGNTFHPEGALWCMSP